MALLSAQWLSPGLWDEAFLSSAVADQEDQKSLWLWGRSVALPLCSEMNTFLLSWAIKTALKPRLFYCHLELRVT